MIIALGFSFSNVSAFVFLSAGAWRLRAADRGWDMGVGSLTMYTEHGSRLYCPIEKWIGSCCALRPPIPTPPIRSERVSATEQRPWNVVGCARKSNRTTSPLPDAQRRATCARAKTAAEPCQLFASVSRGEALSRLFVICSPPRARLGSTLRSAARCSAALLLAALLLCCSLLAALLLAALPLCCSLLAALLLALRRLCLSTVYLSKRDATPIGTLTHHRNRCDENRRRASAMCGSVSRALGWIPRGRRSKP